MKADITKRIRRTNEEVNHIIELIKQDVESMFNAKDEFEVELFNCHARHKVSTLRIDAMYALIERNKEKDSAGVR